MLSENTKMLRPKARGLNRQPRAPSVRFDPLDLSVRAELGKKSEARESLGRSELVATAIRVRTVSDDHARRGIRSSLGPHLRRQAPRVRRATVVRTTSNRSNVGFLTIATVHTAPARSKVPPANRPYISREIAVRLPGSRGT
jgi:hypothetical protein